MKKQIKLTESDLKMVIEGAVRNILKEYDPHMVGAGAARGLEKGSMGPWNAAQKIMAKDKWDKTQMDEFQKGFERKPIQQNGTELEEYTDREIKRMYGYSPDEDDFYEGDFNESPVNNLVGENKNQVKLTESQLKEVIRESVYRILKEAYGASQVGQYQMGRLAARKKNQGDEEGYKNVVNKAKLQWGADRGVGTNHNAFGNGMHVGKDNVKQGYDMAKKGKL